jgi:hypothetical protein
MKDTLEILWALILATSLTFYKYILEVVGLVQRYIFRFMYLYLMNDYQKTDYRNFVAGRVRELKSYNDPNLELTSRKTSELYQWMCDNQ